MSGRDADRVERVAALKRDIVFDARLRGAAFTFHSTWGLFSPRQIDAGSRLLIEHLDLDPYLARARGRDGDGERERERDPARDRDLRDGRDVRAVLDLGCGYGAMGIAIARALPGATVHMVDRDFVAIDLARKNADRNGLGNCQVYLSNGFSAVPERLRFDLVVSNLPAKTGNEMLSILLHDAHARMVRNGAIYVVTISGLRKWLKRNLLDIFGSYIKVKQGRLHTVAMAVKRSPAGGEPPAVAPAADDDDDGDNGDDDVAGER